MSVSLLDDLRAGAKLLDAQFEPAANEVASVLGSVVHYLQFGDEFLRAVEGGAEDLQKLLAPPPPEPEQPAEPTPSPAAEPAAPLTDSELDAQIADLEAQRDARKATAQQTTVDHEPGAAA